VSTTLPTVLISGASEELTARIEHLIRGQAELSLVKSVTPEEAVDETFKAKLIWIELESDPEGNVALLEHLIKSHPNTFFVVSKEDLEPDLVKRTMQVGALDFLDHKGWAAQIRSVVRRIMAKEFGTKPNPNSPMSGAARQPQRPSSWGALNSLKVTVPPNSGFKRVEPGKTSGLPQPAAPPEVPVAAAPQAIPEPTEVEEVAEVAEVVEEVQEEPPYEEAAEAGVDEAAAGYAEGEVGYAEGDAGYAAEGDAGYATEGDAGYSAEGEAGYATEGDAGYAAEGEVGYAPEAASGYAEGEYAEAAEGGETGYDAEGQPTYTADGETAADETVVDEHGNVIEYAEATESDGGNYTEESSDEAPDQNVDESESEPASAPPMSANPGQSIQGKKSGWGDLDSIISTGKAQEKKAPSKWGELSSIQPAKSAEKESTPASSEANKWSDLDAIAAKSSPESDSPAAKSANKWGDLDAIAGKGAAASSAGNKWGDLDGLATKSEPATPSANKWSGLDSIGANPEDSDSDSTPSSSVGNKWGDLDAIATGGAKGFDTDQPTTGESPTTGAKKWGDLESITAPKEAPEPAGNKWGNLDALGGKGSAPKTNAKSFIKPKAAQPDAAAAAAKAKWGDLAATDPPSGGQPESSPGGGAKWGNLDTIGGGITKSQPLPFDIPAASTDGVGAEPKWGNLNSIPTPKAGPEGGNWGDLGSIPTPKAPEAGPVLVEGALPIKLDTNEASQKWKAGMSSDISTGARQGGEMRDKLKGKQVKVKVGWEKVNILVAVVILATAGFLSYSFFTYPVPPSDQTATR